MHRILVIDDDPSVCSFLRRGLMLAGFTVQTAADGPAGLEALERFAPHLVILDRKMGGMSGPEVLARLRERCPRLPVIMLTGRVPEDSEDDGLGVEAYLIKPVEFQELLGTIGALIGRP
ncbi:MAG: response regulator [Armatimonadota bacterium]